MAELAGKIQTVLGTIAPEELGITLPHEHLFADITCLVEAPEEASQRGRAYQAVSLENLGWIRYNYFRNFDNSRLTDEDTALSELDLFRRAGGGTIVEVTTVGIGRDPIALARVARASGVNIVMSTGWYVDPTHPPSVSAASEEELVSRMVTEIRDGAVLERPSAPGHDVTRSDVHTDVRAGVIKVGCSYPLTIDEKKVIHAAAETQRQTGAAITFHVGRDDRSASEIIGVLKEAGADMEHTILGHLELEDRATRDARPGRRERVLSRVRHVRPRELLLPERKSRHAERCAATGSAPTRQGTRSARSPPRLARHLQQASSVALRRSRLRIHPRVRRAAHAGRTWVHGGGGPGDPRLESRSGIRLRRGLDVVAVTLDGRHEMTANASSTASISAGVWAAEAMSR